MMTVFFTWNSGNNRDAMKLACEHLASVGSCVAAFQEPPEVDAATITGWTGDRLALLDVAGSEPGKVIFVASHDISIDPTGARHRGTSTLDVNRRLEGMTLLSEAGKQFKVLGVHGLDQLNHRTAFERNSAGKLLRDVLDSFWSGGPLVVLGDLQANPFDHEITHRTGLHALRKKDFPDGGLKLPQSSVTVRALYNPMWPLLLDTDEAHGTFHFRGETDLFWHCIDQIVVSIDLAPHVGKPEIRTTLLDANNTSRTLVTRQGLPDKQSYSDHLPVQMTVDLDKA